MQLTKKGKSDFPLIHDGPSFLKKKRRFFPRGKRKRMGPSEISANRNRRDNGGKTAAAKFLP